MEMTYFNNLNHEYNRVIFEFTNEEKKEAGFYRTSKEPAILEILRLLHRIVDENKGSKEAYLSELEETMKRFSREDHANLQRKKDGWKAKALRLIGFLNDKDKELKRKIEALEYYADEEIYKETKEWTHDNCFPVEPCVLDDKGEIAREAMEESK